VFGVEDVEHIEEVRREIRAIPAAAIEAGLFRLTRSRMCGKALISTTMIGLSRPGVVNLLLKNRNISIKRDRKQERWLKAARSS